MKQRWGKPQMQAWSSSEFSGVELGQQCHFNPTQHKDEEPLTVNNRGYCLQKLLKCEYILKTPWSVKSVVLLGIIFCIYILCEI